MGPCLRRDDSLRVARSYTPQTFTDSNFSNSAAQTCLRDLAAAFARGLPRTSRLLKFRGRRECRALDAPAASCVKKQTHERSHHGHTGIIPAFPAQWFYGLLRALPGDQACLTPSPARLLADLTPTLGRQNDTTSPSASARFVKRTARVHRIPPHVRNVRTPLCGTGPNRYSADFTPSSSKNSEIQKSAPGRYSHTSRLQKPSGAAWLAPMPAKTSEPKEQPAETPHYHGHRERLRERFHGAGPDALSDYELLEIALFPALPRRDTKPLAKTLLKTFGSFAEVIHAPIARLREIDGIGDAAITQLKLIAAAASRIAKCQLQQRTVLSSWNEVIDYCRTSMAFADKEQFRMLHPCSILFINFNPL
jgi:hypothetical protein